MPASDQFNYSKILLIGATSGIGNSLTHKILAERPHAKLLVVGRREEKLQDLVSQYGEDRVEAFPFDVTDLEGIEGFVGKILTAHPDLSCLFLNSGIQRPLSFLNPTEISLSDIHLEFTTNYFSYVYFLKYLLPHFQGRMGEKETAVVMVGSVLGLVPMTRCGNYCATKAALHQLVLPLRKQMSQPDAPGRIKVIEIFPPSVQTELHDTAHQPDLKNGRSIGMPLDEFTSEAWAGLERGDEDIPVGMGKGIWEAVEPVRREAGKDFP